MYIPRVEGVDHEPAVPFGSLPAAGIAAEFLSLLKLPAHVYHLGGDSGVCAGRLHHVRLHGGRAAVVGAQKVVGQDALDLVGALPVGNIRHQRRDSRSYLTTRDDPHGCGDGVVRTGVDYLVYPLYLSNAGRQRPIGVEHLLVGLERLITALIILDHALANSFIKINVYHVYHLHLLPNAAHTLGCFSTANADGNASSTRCT